jgi:uncharacterized iron-regulated protein
VLLRVSVDLVKSRTPKSQLDVFLLFQHSNWGETLSINLMPMLEKNQVMRNANNMKMMIRYAKLRCCFILYTAMLISLWGCAVTPQKLNLKGKPDTFDEGTIISTQQSAAVSFEALLEDLQNSRVIYLGEKHTSQEDHRIQLEVIQALFQKFPNLAVGMEMFDHSYQEVLDQWSVGKLDQKDFIQKVHWYANWRYDFSLYKDILEFIKDNRLRLVGLNIPNHIPPKIREGGIESLRDDEKKHLPQQLELSNTAHRDYVQKVFEGHGHHFRGEVEFDNFYAAQVVWEDGMAAAIAENLNNDVMVVLAGNGHIQFKYGIPDRAFKLTGAAFTTIYPAATGAEVEPDIADYIWVTK